MKAMFAGDMHGNMDHAQWLFRKAFDLQVDTVIACGDFGYWPHYKWGQKYLDLIDQLTDMSGTTLMWVDGNHENHDLLDDLAANYGMNDPIPTGERSYWIPRGCTFQLGDLTLMGYGGAWSVDWENRSEGLSWWPQETINEEHVASLPSTKVDVLVTHEAPLSTKSGILSYKDAIRESVDQRRLITEVAARVNPEVVFCGHHHIRETFRADTPYEPLVHVLGRDEAGRDSFFVMDMDQISLAACTQADSITV